MTVGTIFRQATRAFSKVFITQEARTIDRLKVDARRDEETVRKILSAQEPGSVDAMQVVQALTKLIWIREERLPFTIDHATKLSELGYSSYETLPQETLDMSWPTPTMPYEVIPQPACEVANAVAAVMAGAFISGILGDPRKSPTTFSYHELKGADINAHNAWARKLTSDGHHRPVPSIAESYYGVAIEYG